MVTSHPGTAAVSGFLRSISAGTVLQMDLSKDGFLFSGKDEMGRCISAFLTVVPLYGCVWDLDRVIIGSERGQQTTGVRESERLEMLQVFDELESSGTRSAKPDLSVMRGIVRLRSGVSAWRIWSQREGAGQRVSIFLADCEAYMAHTAQGVYQTSIA